MGATVRIGRWGSNLAVRIPKTIAQRWGVSEGSGIEMTLRGDQVVLRKPAYKLADVQAVSYRVHSPSGSLAVRGLSKPDLPVDCPAQSSAHVLQKNTDSVLSCYSDRFVRL